MPPPTGPVPRRAPDDATLLRRAVAGDGAAFGALVERHGGIATATARRILGATPAAEDAVQEALLQLWRSGASYRPDRGSLRTWLVVLVRCRAIDHLRREHVRVAATERAGALAAAAAPLVTLDAVGHRDDAHRVLRAITRLPHEQAQAVSLQVLGGHTQREIAAGLDVPLGTIKGRTRLALGKLRRELEPDAAVVA